MESLKRHLFTGLIICLLTGFISQTYSQSLSVTPMPAYIGKIPIGSSGSRDISIFNITASNVSITGISITGSAASKFMITNNPGTVSLSPLQELILNVVYTPSAMGEDIAILEIKTGSATFTDSLLAYGSVVLDNVSTFERIFGTSENDSGNMLRQTQDGGFIIGGSTTKPDENYPDAYFVKTDKYGKPLWSKIYGGIYTDGVSDVLVLSDGSFLTVGTSDSYGSGTNDVYIRKLNSNGDEIWLKSFSTTYDENAGRVIAASDGGFIISGSTKNTADKSSNALIIKIDDSGNLVWKKDYGDNGGQYGSDILPTSDGGYIFSGSTADPVLGLLDVMLTKIDVSGNVVWQKNYGGSESDEAGSLYATSDGGYILGGYTASYGAGARDAYMIKIDSEGNEQWHKTFGTAHSDGFSRVIQTPDGGYICVGHINAYFSQQFIYNDLLIVRTDSQGNLLWQKTFGGSKDDSASKIILSSSGGYVVLGTTSSYDPKSKIYLIGLNNDGNITKISDDGKPPVPVEFTLAQNYPNPFNPSTNIDFTLKEDSFINLSVFDLLGNRVATLINGRQNAGTHTRIFDASNLPSGIYFYKLEARIIDSNSGGGFISTKKMILIK